MSIKYRSALVAFIIFAACGLTLIAVSLLERDSRKHYILIPLKDLKGTDKEKEKELPDVEKPCP